MTEEIGFDFRQRQEFVLLSTAFRPALRLTHPPIQRVPGALSPEMKWTGLEADN
jgi:hypothetical protein